jgi:ubiquinone/menaquinone biosynthesis C-methylase UbiE
MNGQSPSGEPLYQQQLTSLFDELASSYVQIVPFFGAFGAKMAEWVGAEDGMSVLDIAAGRGALVFPMLKKVGALGRITAIDLSEEMVAATRRSIEHNRIPNVRVFRMDAGKLGFEDECFDVALSGFAMHLLPHPDAAFEEAFRVLKPGGVFAFSVPGPTSGSRWQFYSELIEEFGSQLDTSGWSLPEPPDLEALLMQTGFTSPEKVNEEVHLPVRDAPTFWNSEMSHGMRGFILGLPLGARREFEKKVIANLQRMHERGGIILDRGAVFYKGYKPG